MVELQTVVTVIVLFMIRIGIPLALLVGLGVLIDRWQSKRQGDIQNYIKDHQ